MESVLIHSKINKNFSEKYKEEKNKAINIILYKIINEYIKDK
tara:strand:- start:472 stop:597 length:126 start_codon:yes stop_codon:yes gene_type:complete